MTYRKTYYILTFLTLSLFFGCSLENNVHLPSFKKKTKNTTKIDEWSNYYYGVTPCASCSGIETWLFLKHTKQQNSFNLVENYLEEQDGVFITKGSFKQEDDVIKLISTNKQSYLRINNNSASLIKSPKSLITPQYTLEKLMPFKDMSKTVLVIPKSVQKKISNSKKTIEFNALTNFHLITSHANKSLKAHYIVGCNEQISYIISKGIYYKGIYATEESKPYLNQNALSFESATDAIKQAQEFYCGK